MFLTMKEAAARLGLTTARLRVLAKAGRIQAVATLGERGDRLFTEAAVAEFAAIPRKPGNLTGFPHAKRQEKALAAKKLASRKSNSSKGLSPPRKKPAKNSV